jgi:hypothetical protein
MDIDRILKDYRTGDEEKRLNLFLSYRDLRDEFSSIDEETERAAFSRSLTPALLIAGIIKCLHFRI